MNPRARCLVCAPMAQQRPTPAETERGVERMFAAMKDCVAACPLMAVGSLIGALAALTDEATHAQGFLRLQVIARIHPELTQAAAELVDQLLNDKASAVRGLLVKPAG